MAKISNQKKYSELYNNLHYQLKQLSSITKGHKEQFEKSNDLHLIADLKHLTNKLNEALQSFTKEYYQRFKI